MSIAPLDTSEFEERIRGREVNSDQTVTDYCRWVARFEAWAGGGNYDENTLRDFDSFLQDESRRDYPWENDRGKPAPASYAYQTRVKALSAAKLWLKHEKSTTVTTEVQNIAQGEPADFEPTILDPHEVAQIKADASNCHHDGCRAAIYLGYDAIMRGAEVAHARQEDLDYSEQAIKVRAVKGSNNTKISLSNDAWNAVRHHAEKYPERDRLFLNAYGNRLTAAAWNNHFRRQHHDAGFHAVARHSAIVNRLRDGEDFGEVYLRARHVNPSTTIQYVSFVPDMDKPDWF